MILGTASHVGKSILTAALGRILADEGYRVAPFKAQNMSLNSAATPDGHEIGRAQALQAEACRVAPRAEMNPVLIKPSSDTSAQVVVMGRVWRQVTAAEYWNRPVDDLFPIVVDAWRALAAEHDIIVMEGAGSPAEINLKARDIVNMRMARAANAACLLVGDIDRGGVFASLLGTVELLDADERALLRGFIVNKFRGDRTLLSPGIEIIERRIGLPCAGVVPHLPDLDLDEEDCLAEEKRPSFFRLADGPQRPLRIAVLAFPYIANFTDFDALAAEPSVSLAYINDPRVLAQADLVILPGSKQTLDDLAWLRRRGLVPAIHAFPGRILGICGGMQMLGFTIEDAHGAENGGVPRTERGLGLLPIATALRREKVVRQSVAQAHVSVPDGLRATGYEIHLGETIYQPDAEPFAEIRRNGDATPHRDGAVAGRVSGTYLHGLFADDAFRDAYVDAARTECGLAPANERAFFTAKRERRIDRLADHVRRAIDMNLIRSLIQ
jgi:adenosylcobyric acid synthase